jgi:hypothetical protein
MNRTTVSARFWHSQNQHHEQLFLLTFRVSKLNPVIKVSKAVLDLAFET